MSIQDRLEEYKSQFDELRQRDNESWKKTFEQTCPCCNQRVKAKENSQEVHRLISEKLLLQEGELKREMLNDETVSFLVCNTSVTWQAKQEESNYDLDRRFARRFPMAVTDSESGQGWAYINTRYIEEVRQYMSETEGLIEHGDQGYGTFSITTNIEDDEHSGFDDHYHRDHLTVQWKWKESTVSI